MLIGKRFRLRSATVAIDSREGRRVAIVLPAEAVVKVVSAVEGRESLLNVLWNGRLVAVFAKDLEYRGREVAAVQVSSVPV